MSNWKPSSLAKSNRAGKGATVQFCIFAEQKAYPFSLSCLLPAVSSQLHGDHVSVPSGLCFSKGTKYFTESWNH